MVNIEASRQNGPIRGQIERYSHLEGQSEGLVSGPGGGNDSVEGLEESHAAGLALLPLHVPSLVPGHVLGGLDHVVSMPPGDGDEGDGGGVVADLLDEVADLLGDLLKPSLGVGRLGRVHLVASNDELLDTEGVGEEGVLPGLPVLGDAGLKLTSAGGDDKNSAVSLNKIENNAFTWRKIRTEISYIAYNASSGWS